MTTTPYPLTPTTKHGARRGLLALATLLLGTASLAASAQDKDDELTLIVPPWPGVTVKSEIVAQILAPLGYDVERQEVTGTIG